MRSNPRSNPNRIDRVRGLMLSAAVATVCTVPTRAATWNNAGGGSWQTPGNWTPNGIPGAADPTVFGLSATYGVNLAADASAASAAINAGVVGFNFAGFTLTVTGSTTVASGATLNFNSGTLKTTSLDSSTGSLNWSDGTINVNGGTFKPKQATVTLQLTPANSISFANSILINGAAGAAARPTLNVSGGGTISLTRTSNNDDGSILIGLNGGKGAATVSGATSALNTPTNAGELVIGLGGTTVSSTFYGGDGTLTLTAGGQAVCFSDANIGLYGGTGRVNVDGVGSKFSSTNGGLYVGYDRYGSAAGQQGDGTLTLSNGGQASSAGDTSIGGLGGRGVVTVGLASGDSGGTKLSATNLYLSQANAFSGSASDAGGTLTVNPGGAVELTGVLQTYTNTTNANATKVNLAGGTIKTGSVSFENRSHLNWTAGTLWLTGNTTNNIGALTIPDGGLLKGSGVIQGTVTAGGALTSIEAVGTLSNNTGYTVLGGRTLDITGGTVLLGGDSPSGSAVRGELYIRNGSIFDNRDITGVEAPGGKFRLRGGELRMTNYNAASYGLLQSDDGSTLIEGYGTLSARVSLFNGKLQASGGTLNVTGAIGGSGTVEALAGSTLNLSGGNGTFGAVTAFNVLGTANLTAPFGATTTTVSSAGTLNNTGLYTLGSGQTLAISGGTFKTGSLNTAAGALNFSDGTLTVDGGVFTPKQATVTLQLRPDFAITFANSVLVNGVAGASARPTLNLSGGTISLTRISNNDDGSIFLGLNGGKGAATVSGATSTLNTPTNAGQLVIGLGGATVGSTFYGGDGTLALTAGGQAISFSDTNIGLYGGTGRVSVDGAGSKFSSTNGTLYIGYERYGSAAGQQGDGTLTLTNGGQASSSSDFAIGFYGGVGSVSVTGTSSLATTTNGYLKVGAYRFNTTDAASQGTLTLSSGGQATAATGISIGLTGGIGQAFVSGANSKLASSGGLYVGDSRVNASAGMQGDGTLVISAGGLASSVADTYIGYAGGTGHATVDGLNSKLSTSAGYLQIGYDRYSSAAAVGGDGTLALTNGGQVTSALGIYIGRAGGTGRVTVDGTNSKLASTSSGSLYVGFDRYSSAAGLYGDGTLTLTNGGQASLGLNTNIGTFGGAGVINVGKSDGTDTGTAASPTALTVGSTLVLGRQTGTNADSKAQLNIYKNGLVSVFGATTLYQTGTTTDYTLLTLAGGTLKTGTLDLQNASARFAFNSGTLHLNGGSIINPGATPLTIPADGTLKGNGTVNGAVVDLGTISPGDGTTATFALSSGVTIGSTGASATRGTLAADINFGTSVSDLLNVTGAVNLTNAKLSFSMLSSVAGPTNKIFLLINNDDTDAVNGTFAAVDPAPFPGLQYQLFYNFSGAALNGSGNGNDVAIQFTAVPEPTFCTAAVFIGSLLARRRSGREKPRK